MCLFPKEIYTEFGEKRLVSCGKCVECALAESSHWTCRLLYEAEQYDDNCVVTLTYDELHNPGVLLRRDYQNFLKRLRKAIYPQKVRYFCSAEYGSVGGRPHFHLILFGWRPDDLYIWKRGQKGSIQYRSPFIESLWKYGFSTVGEMSYNSAFYTAKYLQKLVYTDEEHKPFVAMSTHPGIGANAFDEQMFVDDACYYHGHKVRLPRYYERLAVKRGYSLAKLRSDREQIRLLKISKPLALKARRALMRHRFGVLRRSDFFSRSYTP